MSLPSYVEVINPPTKPVPVVGGGSTSTVDVTDRSGRLVGHVTIDSVTGTVTVSGSVSVSNFPASQVVSGSVSVSNFPATQPVSAASLPLPANAAQETGGNLAAIKSDLDEIALDADNLPGINTQVSRLPTPLFGLSSSLSYGVSVLAACSASEPSLMDGQVSMPSLTPDGRIRVNLDDEPTGLWGADDEDDIWALDQDGFNLDVTNF